MKAVVWFLGAMVALGGCVGGPGGDDAAGDADDAEGPADRDAPGATTASTAPAYLQNPDYSLAHVHDYWAGATEKELMNEGVTASDGAFGLLLRPFTDGTVQTGIGSAPFTLPNGTFVPEGTGELLVEVDATAALKGGEIALSYRPADSGDAITMDAQPAQASWSIELAPEMADVPHARKTRWEFRIDAAGAGSVLDGEMNVRIVAVRLFDLAAWPAHPDFWQAGTLDSLALGNSTGEYDYLTQHMVGPDDNAAYERVFLPEGTLVPPETQAIVVTLLFERSSDPKNAINGPLILTVRDGATSRGSKVMHGNAIDCGPGHITYALPVGSDTWDSPYADQSGWSFTLHAPFGLHDVPPDGSTRDVGGLDVGAGSYDVGTVAYRVVPDWLGEVLKEEIGREGRPECQS